VLREPDPMPRAEAAERSFDPRLACWVRPLPPAVQAERRLPSVTPISDGSGVRWTVWSNEGQPMWTFEAIDFPTALDEKRRLCAGNGYRSGWAHLRPAQPGAR
jgi:hypothetical protein